MALKLSDLQGEYEVIEKPKTGIGAGLGTFAKGVGTGIVKSLGEAALGVGELGRKVQNKLGLNVTGGQSMFDTEQAKQIRETTLAANAPGEGTGKFIGTTAQYLLPTSGIAKGQSILGAAARQLPSTVGGKGLLKSAGNLALGTAGTAAKIGARFAPEAIGTGAVAAFRSGGDLEQTKEEALLAGGFSVGLGALGKLARASYWPTLDDSVSKALGVQGKKSGAVALQDSARKIAGLKVLKERAPKLSVLLEDGSKTAFDPDNASYGTTLQAWNDARKQVFNEYTAAAKAAGEKTTLDLSSVRQMIENAKEAPLIQTELNAVDSVLRDFDRIFKDPKNVDMEMAERFVKSLNDNTAQGFYTGTADAASSKVYAGTSKYIRDIMDETIEESSGAQYQALRSQYAALKSLENDLVRKFQQDARSIGGGLPEYTGAFASGDIIASALSLDPAQFAKGATLGTFAVLKRNLSNPERFLRRSFDLIDEVPSDLTVRLFGGTKPLTAQEAKMASNVAESIKNPNIGLSIKNVADDPSFSKGATPETKLAEEAKKYKSAEEFISKQPTKLYHRTNVQFDDFDIDKSYDGLGTWFFNKKEMGDEYINDFPILMERYFDRPLKTITESKLDKLMNTEKWLDSDLPAREQLLKEGYEAIDYGGGVIQVLDTKILKTRTQLEDIWKKANETKPTLLEEAKKYKSAEEFVEAVRKQSDNAGGQGLRESKLPEVYKTVKVTPANAPTGNIDFLDVKNVTAPRIQGDLKLFEPHPNFKSSIKAASFDKGKTNFIFLKPGADPAKLQVRQKYEFAPGKWNTKDYFLTNDGGKSWFQLEPVDDVNWLEAGKLSDEELVKLWEQS